MASSKYTAQSIVAVIGTLGLLILTGMTFFLPELGDERQMLIGALIALVSGAGVWLFSRNGK